MNITPEEIPSDAAPLVDFEIPETTPLISNLRDLHSKNVFVCFKNKKTATGLLLCQPRIFTVGTSNEHYFYDDVESFRNT